MKTLASKTKEDVKLYTKLRSNLVLLYALKYASLHWAKLGTYAVLAFMVLFTFVFGSLGLVFYCHEYLTFGLTGSFFLVSGLWLVILLLAITTRKILIRPIIQNNAIRQWSVYLNSTKAEEG